VCVCSTVVAQQVAARQDGGGRRHKALAHFPGGFALLEIKLKALLDWGVVGESKGGRREFVQCRPLHDDLTGGENVGVFSPIERGLEVGVDAFTWHMHFEWLVYGI
jgi:hypothetical protein